MEEKNENWKEETPNEETSSVPSENQENQEVPQTPSETEEKETQTFDSETFVPTSRKEKRKKKNPIGKIILVFFLLLILALGGFYIYYTSCLKPISNEDKEIIVTIDKGSTVTKIADILEENGLIRSSFVFRLYAKQIKASNLQAGTYKLTTNMSVDQILDRLRRRL